MSVRALDGALLFFLFFELGCRGSGLVGSPGTPLAPAGLDFGKVVTGSRHSLPLAFQNVGSGSLTLLGGSLQGDPSFAAQLSRATLAAGQSTHFEVGFAPTQGGVKNATLVLRTDSNVRSDLSVLLTGLAEDPDSSFDAGPSSDAGTSPVDGGPRGPPPGSSPSPYAAGAWPKWHHDNANSGLSRADTRDNQGRLLWSFPIGIPVAYLPDELASYIASPAVGTGGPSGEIVYQLGYGFPLESETGTLFALDARTGQQLWATAVTRPEGLAQEGTPTLAADGSIYLSTGGEQLDLDQLYHLDSQGRILSSFKQGDGHDNCPDLSADGTLYLFDDEGCALDAYDTHGRRPRPLWSAPGLPDGRIESFSAALGMAGQLVFSWGGMAECFDGRGRLLWGNADLSGSGRLALGRVTDNDLACGDEAKSSPLLLEKEGGVDAIVVYASYDPTCSQAVGGVTALDLASGRTDWILELPTLAPPTDPGYVDDYRNTLIAGYSSPALLPGGAIVFGYLDGIYAIEAGTNGGSPSVLWYFSTGLVLSSPAVGADGTVFVGSAEGNFYALDGATGQLKWGLSVGAAVNSSPAIGRDGTVYFSADDGNLYAVK